MVAAPTALLVKVTVEPETLAVTGAAVSALKALDRAEAIELEVLVWP